MPADRRWRGNPMRVPMRIVVERDVECVARDGTILRADVYRPAEGRHPVLVSRTPYSKDHPMAVTNLMFPPLVGVARGYVVVVQDVRGRFASDGVWYPIHGEADDTYDTVEWASSQPWSDGQVGLFGSSYMGVTTLQGVATAPPHLAAAVAYLTGANYQDGWVHTGGAFELLFNLRWTAGQALAELHRFEFPDGGRKKAGDRLSWILDNPSEALCFTPLEEIFAPLDHVVPYWREWLSHPSYDSYWEAVDLTRSLHRARVPVLNIAGWYDGFLGGQLAADRALEAAGAGLEHQLVIGPWDHEAYQGMRPNAAGDAFFGSEAVSGAAGLSPLILGWFDRWLRPAAADARQRDDTRVRYFHMGLNEWRTADQWPPKATNTTLYLHSAGAANTRHGNGVLATEPAPAEAVDTVDSFLHDPRNPVPTRGGRHLGYGYGRAGVQDQAEVELRHDVLCYTSPLLVASLDVIGAVRLRLYVRSSAKCTDFTAKLVDVRPNGYCANVAEGVVRVGPMADDVTDGGPLPVDIDLWDTSYRFEKHHRVRLEIASSNFPRFDRNGNLPAVPAATAEHEWTCAVQHVLCGPRYPSALVLGGQRSHGEL